MSSNLAPGQRVRFQPDRTARGRVMEGTISRWRPDSRRGGKVGWYDVMGDDGFERSVRPSGVESISTVEKVDPAKLGFVDHADVPVHDMRRSIHRSHRGEGKNFVD